MPILAVTNATKQFTLPDHTVDVLRDASFEVSTGEFVSIMGASGSGKSTLLYLIAGLEPLTSGQIAIEDEIVTDLSDDRCSRLRREKIGFIFQFYNLLPDLTAWENVALPLILDGEDPQNHRERIDELIKLVGLEERATHRPETLSGGEQQRVAIARALLRRPALVLADEPTGNLDSHHREDIYRLLAQLAHEHNQTVVMVTHDAAGAASADRVLFLKDGRVVGDHQVKDLDPQTLSARYQDACQ